VRAASPISSEQNTVWEPEPVAAEGFFPLAIDPGRWEQEMYAVRARRDRLADTWYRALAIALSSHSHLG